MTKKINYKTIGIVSLFSIIGAYLVLFEAKIITGLLVIMGGIILNFKEVKKWVEGFIVFMQSFRDSQGDTLTQYHPSMSPQTVAKDNAHVNIQYQYYENKNLPEREIKIDKKSEMIKEINCSLPKEKVSETLMKCIRLATLLDSTKDVYWLENEAYGFDEDKRGKIKEKDIPDYRIINTEIRITNDPMGTKFTPLPYKLTLGSPIFQIEDWINDAKSSSSREFILTAPMTENFKKIYKDVFKQEPPEESIPYNIKVQELKNILYGLKLRIAKFVNMVEKR